MEDEISFEPPDKVFLTFEGNLSPEKVEEVLGRLRNLVKPGEKIKLILNVKDLVDVPPESREAFREMGSDFQMTRLVVVGASVKMKILGGLIIKMLPNIEDSKFVKTRDEALAWLEEGK